MIEKRKFKINWKYVRQVYSKDHKREKLIKKLSWHKSKITQRKAIKALVKMPDSVLFLVLPNRMYCKSMWENAAIVLKEKGIMASEIMWIELFYWIQDLNWPGSLIIYDLLKTMPRDEFDKWIHKAIQIADILDDSDWLINLNNLLADMSL
ncbi:hypothetical protein RJI07_06135 [Mycoplasmatota bacterium WC30]